MSSVNPNPVALEPSQADASDTASASANAAVTISRGGASGIAHILGGLAFSYGGSGTLSGGAISITDGGTTVFQLEVAAKGHYVIPFEPALRFGAGNSVVVTLAAGGANVTGMVNLLGHRIEAMDDSLSQMDFQNQNNSVFA